MKMGVTTEVPGLFKNPDGWTLRAKSKVGSVTTEKRTKLVGATKAQAMVVLERLQEEARVEAEAKSKGEDIRTTLSVFARRYVEELGRRGARGNIRKATAANHADNLERFILPFVGAADVTTFAPRDVKAWLRTLEQLKTPAQRRGAGRKTYAQEPRPYARASLANVWRTMRAFLAWVTVEADLPRNPAAYVRWESDAAPPKQKTVLTQGEVVRLLDAAKADRDRSAWTMIAVALVGALRASELSALRREDVDLDRGTITIQRSHVDGDIGQPKTKGSRRCVIVPSAVVDAVRALMEWQDGQQTKGLPLLFPTTFGTPKTPATINDLLERLAKAATIDRVVTSHALRCTANNLIRQSAGDLVARAVTGHVTQQMTEHYSLVDVQERTEALQAAFGAALSGTGTTRPGAEEETPPV